MFRTAVILLLALNVPSVADVEISTSTLATFPENFLSTANLAIDGEGHVHVLFVTEDPVRVVYATNGSGSWVQEEIGVFPSRATHGLIEVDAAGYPHVVFLHKSIPHYGTRNAEWDMVQLPVEKASFIDLALSDGVPSVCLFEVSDNRKIVVRTLQDGAWPPDIVGFHPGFSSWCRLVVDDQKRTHVTYWNNGLRYVRRNESQWWHGPSVPDAYAKHKLAVDGEGNLHVLSGLLELATLSGGQWEAHTIGSASGTSDLDMDDTGRPHIVYSSYSSELRYTHMYAVRAGGDWYRFNLGSNFSNTLLAVVADTDGTAWVLWIKEIDTEFTLQVSEVRVEATTPPVIEEFAASRMTLARNATVRLNWDVDGALGVRIDPGDVVSTESVGTFTTQLQETTTFTLIANNRAGVDTANVTVEVLPFIVDRFEALPPSLFIGGSTTLWWSIRGEVDATLVGVGPVTNSSFHTVSPLETTEYILRVRSGGFEEIHSVTVPVFDIPSPSILLSWSPDELLTTLQPLDGLRPLQAYVLLSGHRKDLLGFEFGIDLPPDMILTDTELHSPAALNVGTGLNWIVGTGACVSPVPYHRLLTLHLFPTSLVNLDGEAITLRPAQPASVPGGAAIVDCGGETLVMPLGEPLVIATDPVGAVPVLDLRLRAHQVGTGVEIKWDLPDNAVSRSVVRTGPHGLKRRWTVGPDQQSMLDQTIDGGGPFRYLVEANHKGQTMTDEVEILLSSRDTLARLLPNHPNPFSTETRIRLQVERPGDAQITIYDVSGRLVRSTALRAGSAGIHEWTWDGLDHSGQPVGSGRYFVAVRTDGRTMTRSVLRLK